MKEGTLGPGEINGQPTPKNVSSYFSHVAAD